MPPYVYNGLAQTGWKSHNIKLWWSTSHTSFICINWMTGVKKITDMIWSCESMRKLWWASMRKLCNNKPQICAGYLIYNVNNLCCDFVMIGTNTPRPWMAVIFCKWHFEMHFHKIKMSFVFRNLQIYFLQRNVLYFLNKISLKLVSESAIYNKSILFQITACTKQFTKPMMTIHWRT